MKNDTALTVTSLLTIVLFSLHQAGDVVRGIEPGGLKNLQGMSILVVWGAATLLLMGRRLGYVIILLGSLLTTLMPVSHLMGKGVGAIAASPGGFFFVWTLYAIGVVAPLSVLLSVRGLWLSRMARRDSMH